MEACIIGPGLHYLQDTTYECKRKERICAFDTTCALKSHLFPAECLRSLDIFCFLVFFCALLFFFSFLPSSLDVLLAPERSVIPQQTANCLLCFSISLNATLLSRYKGLMDRSLEVWVES